MAASEVSQRGRTVIVCRSYYARRAGISPDCGKFLAGRGTRPSRLPRIGLESASIGDSGGTPSPLSVTEGYSGFGVQMVAKPYDHTSLGGAGRQFPETEWTRMLDHRQREAVLAALCRDYWKPIYRYLRAMGFRNEQAKDLAQGFFTDKVLGQDLIARADRAKGRFRNFLLRSVRNYAISIQRASQPHQSLGDNQEGHAAAGDPEVQFNRAWADGLLREVLKELELECRQRGKETHWRIFHDWLLDPVIEQGQTMTEICQRYGIPDPSRAYHMIENVKRRFRVLLRDHLGQGGASEGDAEAEIREFIGIFSRGLARS